MDQADNTGVTSTGSPDVDSTSGVVLPDDRPAQNIKAEFDRKFAAQQQKVDAILNWIQTQAAQPQPQPQQSSAELTDEELWQQAQQGNRQAFELYQQRIADRRIRVQAQQAGYVQSVDRQLAAIMNKYPVLQDASHPLTQTANMAYSLLLQQGYPQGRATLLEAAKTAIADRPDLIAELQGASAVTADRSRRTAAQSAQSGATGVTHRQDSTPTTQPKALTPDELSLARKMGVKDPQKSKERFLQRQQEGKSSLGAVAGFVREEDL